TIAALPKVELADSLAAEIHFIQTVFGCRTNPYVLIDEGPTDPEAAVLEPQLSALLHFPNLVVARVLDARELVRHRSWAQCVMRGRHVEVERLMRPLRVVDIAPSIEFTLALRKARPRSSAQDFELERAVKSLVFALCLRMTGARVRHDDPELHQPRRKARMKGPSMHHASPRRSIVHRHSVRQPISP